LAIWFFLDKAIKQHYSLGKEGKKISIPLFVFCCLFLVDKVDTLSTTPFASQARRHNIDYYFGRGYLLLPVGKVSKEAFAKEREKKKLSNSNNNNKQYFHSPPIFKGEEK